jgi:hypothetical protein
MRKARRRAQQVIDEPAANWINGHRKDDRNNHCGPLRTQIHCPHDHNILLCITGKIGLPMSVAGQPRRLSDLGMSASPPTPDITLRRS